jgi:hypothetical protein
VSSGASHGQSANSFRNSLLAKSRNAARADPTLDPQTRLRLFCFDRLLYRIFSHAGASDGALALKGSASLMARLSEARLSKEFDLATKESLGAAERILYEAGSTDAGDFLRFEIAEESDLRPATGKKFRGVVFCGARQPSAFKMDLSVSGEFPIPEELDEGPPFGSIDIPGLPEIAYAAWPFPRVVADKVAASFEMHEGRPSTRYRDLSDLLLLQRQVPFERRRLREAILAELNKRGLEHPGKFRVPERESWERGWRNIAREDALTLTSVSFAEGLSKVKAFLDPVLGEDIDGHWDPTLGRWDA